MVKFGYTINYVRDVDIALSFFEKAFEMTRRFITDENDYGELDTGETVLAFASHELGLSNFSGGYISSTDSEKPLGIEIALITDDVSGIHQRAIQYGAVELKSPETKPWGQVVSYVRCPSGILIELCTPIQS
ncbi:VOC family protein [Marinomonas atlantica]|jgi:catechol 2,3-dioxygenase-like lactoylglutathione lyase family enzyme|uniref:VOC family protein n=1 Tax=Marinomonas atlantica TaxID=1806668 RepID=UPI000A3F4823|nr:VOC family protein [Marinomonas atlantica]